MPLQFENQADIPSGEAENYVEFQDGEKTIWMHSELAEAKKTSYRFQGQMTNLQKDFDGFKGKIDGDKLEAATLAEKQKQDAINAKIAELKGGTDNHDELHTLEMQQLQDKISTLDESNKGWEGKYNELHTSLVEKENLNLAQSIASQYVPSEMVDSFSKLLIMSHIKNVDGKSVFVNASGEACSDDMARVVEVLNKDPNLKHFAKFPGSKGGHGGKGGSTGENSKVISRKDYESKTPQERINLMESKVQIID